MDAAAPFLLSETLNMVDQDQLANVDPETQAKLRALLEAAGLDSIATADGRALADPEVLRQLTSSVSCALDEAAAALTAMRDDSSLVDSVDLDEELENSFGNACERGDLDTVREHIDRGCVVNEVTTEGDTPLSLVVAAGYLDVAKLLLSNQADVNCRSAKNDHTPLMDASANGNVQIVRLLLSYGADVHLLSTSLNTALHLAATNGHEEVAYLLLDAGAKTELQNENGHTPLMEAASNGHVGAAQLLLNRGAGINTHSNEFKESALTLACYKGHLEMVKFLLKSGADHEHKTDEMHTALMEAAMDGHVEVAKLLLAHGAQVNMPADSFESPLTLAACGGHTELASLLIGHGADLEEVNDEGYTPLMEAAREGHEEMVALLLAHGAEINCQTEETQETALTLACCGGFLDVADLLIRCDADIEMGCSTPLMEASQEGHLELVQYLLAHRAKVNAETGTGDTALHYAVENGHAEVAAALVEAGAEVEHESEGGRTPLMKACRSGHLKCVHFLVRCGADVNRTTTAGDHTSLSLACAGGHADCVEYLLSQGSNPRMPLKDCSTVLIEASKGGHLEVVSLLLDYPMNRFKTPNCTPSDRAATAFDLGNSLREPRVPVTGLPNMVPPPPSDTSNKTLNQASPSAPVLEVLTPKELSEELEKFKLTAMLPKAQNRKNVSLSFSNRVAPVMVANATVLIEDESTALMADNNMMHAALPAELRDISEAEMRSLAELRTPEKLENLFTKWVNLQEPTTPQVKNTKKQQFLEELQRVERELNEAGLMEKFRPAVAAAAAANPALTSTNGPITEKLQALVLKTRELFTEVPLSSVSSVPLAPPTGTTVVSRCRSACTVSNTPPPPPTSCNVTEQQALVLQQARELTGQQLQLLQQDTSSTLTMAQMQQLEQQLLAAQKSLAAAQEEYSAQHSNGLSSGSVHTTTSRTTLLPLPVGTASAKESALVDTSISTTCLQPSDCAVSMDQSSQPAPMPQLLVDPLIDINAVTETGAESALTHACQGGHVDLVKLLVDRGAALEHRDKKGFTPLIVAATSGHKAVCEALLDKHADLEACSDRTKDTALSLACSSGRIEVVEMLLSRGANKEHRNVSDYTPLSLAASGGFVNIINLLLKHGAEINSRTGSKLGISPLMLAAMNGHTSAVKLLLDHGSDINAQIETNKNTALTLACFQGRHEVVQLLVDRKANIEHRAKTGLTPLMEAASGGYVEVGRVLLDKGADVNAPPVPTSRDTALTIAADKGHAKFVHLLIERGAYIDARNKKGATPLWLSCNGGHADVVTSLTQAAADVNAQDNRKVSCLMTAFRKGHVKVVKYLVKHCTQFPADNDCIRYTQQLADKELAKKCNQSMDIIVAAKDRQAAEANKNASILLEQLDKEKEKEEAKQQAMQRKRERRKQKKKAKQEEKRPDKDDEEDDDSIGAKDRDDNNFDSVRINGCDSSLGHLASLVVDTNNVGVKISQLSTSDNGISCGSTSVPSGGMFAGNNVFVLPNKSSHTKTIPLDPPPSATTISTTGHNLALPKYTTANGPQSTASTSLPANKKKKKKKVISATKGASEDPCNFVDVSTDSAILQNGYDDYFNHSDQSNLPASSASLVSLPTVVFSSASVNASRPREPDISKSKPSNTAAYSSLSSTPISTHPPFVANCESSFEHTDAISSDMNFYCQMEVKENNSQGWSETTTINHSASVTATAASGSNSTFSSRSRVSPRKGRSARGGAGADRHGNNASNLDDEWKVVVPKRMSIAVPKKDIGKVIGQAGITINSIRAMSGAHIDIDNKETEIGERTVHIRGSADSVNKAKLMIESLMAGKAQKDILTNAVKNSGRSNSSVVVSLSSSSSSTCTRSTTSGSVSTSSRSRRAAAGGGGGGGSAQTNVTNCTSTLPTATVASKPLPIRRTANRSATTITSSLRSAATSAAGSSESFATIYGLSSQSSCSNATGEMNFASVAAAGILSTPANLIQPSPSTSSTTLSTTTCPASSSVQLTLTTQTSNSAISQSLTGFPTISESLAALRDSVSNVSTTGTSSMSFVTSTSDSVTVTLDSLLPSTQSLPTNSASPVATHASVNHSTASMVMSTTDASTTSIVLSATSATSSASSYRSFSRAPGSERHRTPERDRVKATQQNHQKMSVDTLMNMSVEDAVDAVQLSPSDANSTSTLEAPVAQLVSSASISNAPKDGAKISNTILSPGSLTDNHSQNKAKMTTQLSSPSHEQSHISPYAVISPHQQQQQHQQQQHQQQQQQQQYQLSSSQISHHQQHLHQQHLMTNSVGANAYQHHLCQQQAAAAAAALNLHQQQAAEASFMGNFLDFPAYMSRGDMMTLPRAAPSLNPGASSFEPRPKPMEQNNGDGFVGFQQAAQAHYLATNASSSFGSPRAARTSPPYANNYGGIASMAAAAAAPSGINNATMAINNLLSGDGSMASADDIATAIALMQHQQALASHQIGPRPIGAERRRAPIGAERSFSAANMNVVAASANAHMQQTHATQQHQQQHQIAHGNAVWQGASGTAQANSNSWSFEAAAAAAAAGYNHNHNQAAMIAAAQHQQLAHVGSNTAANPMHLGFNLGFDQLCFDQWNQYAPQ